MAGVWQEGDEVTGYAEYQFSDDGRVLNGRTYVGPGSLTHLIYYDEGKKKIETMVSSGGNVWNNTIYKKMANGLIACQEQRVKQLERRATNNAMESKWRCRSFARLFSANR